MGVILQPGAAEGEMSYIRNPRVPNMWESDGDAPWCKYKAADGTMHDSPKEADKHDSDKGWHPWYGATPSGGQQRD